MANLEFCASCGEMLNRYGEEVFSCGDIGPFCVDCWRDHKCCDARADIDRMRAEVVRLGRCSENIFIETGPPDKVTLDSVSVREVQPDGTLGPELIDSPTPSVVYDICVGGAPPSDQELELLREGKYAELDTLSAKAELAFDCNEGDPSSPLRDSVGGRDFTITDDEAKQAGGE